MALDADRQMLSEAWARNADLERELRRIGCFCGAKARTPEAHTTNCAYRRAMERIAAHPTPTEDGDG